MRPSLRLGEPIHRYGDVESTQSIAAALATAGAPEGTTVLADHQRAGRGRRGAVWLDQPGANLLFSLVLRPALAPATVPRLALLAAVAVAEGIEGCTGLVPAIKWPNDLLLGGKKCAGVLAEAVFDGSVVSHVILGVGVNVNQTEFPPDIAEHATSLVQVGGRAVERPALLDAILRELERWYATHATQGFAPIRAAWCKRAATLGQAVVVGSTRGTAVDIDADGALLVRDPANQLRRIVAAEVQHAAGC